MAVNAKFSRGCMNTFERRLENLTKDLIDIFGVDKEVARDMAGVLGMSYIGYQCQGGDDDEESENDSMFDFD